MDVVLVMFRENGQRRSFPLTRDVTVVGRREDADFRIALTDISRKHCRFIKDGNVLVLEDLGSSNGTYQNGSRIQETELNPGDLVQIGPVQFLVQIDGRPTNDELDARAVGRNRETPRSSDSSISHVAPPPVPPSLKGNNSSSIDDEILEVLEDDDALDEVSDEDLIDLDDSGTNNKN